MPTRRRSETGEKPLNGVIRGGIVETPNVMAFPAGTPRRLAAVGSSSREPPQVRARRPLPPARPLQRQAGLERLLVEAKLLPGASRQKMRGEAVGFGLKVNEREQLAPRLTETDRPPARPPRRRGATPLPGAP